MRIGRILNFDFLRNVYLFDNNAPSGNLKIEVNGKPLTLDQTQTTQIKITVNPTPD